MEVEQAMSSPVHAMPGDATASEAARLMRDQNIGCVVVARGKRPEGIVTDRDLALRVIAEERDADEVQLDEIMTPCPFFVLGARDLRYAMEVMREQAVRRLPVVDAKHDLVGVLSLDDVVRRIADELGTVAELIEREVTPTSRRS